MNIIQIIVSLLGAIGVPSLMTVLLNRYLSKKDAKRNDIQELKKNSEEYMKKIDACEEVTKQLQEKVSNMEKDLGTVSSSQAELKGELDNMNELFEMQRSVMDVQAALLEDRIIQKYDFYINKKSMSIRDRKSFNKLVTLYTNLHGDPSVIAAVSKLYDLPVGSDD